MPKIPTKTRKRKLLTPEELEELRQKSYAHATLCAEQGYLQYLDHVIVDAQPYKLPFRSIAEHWQWQRSLRCCEAIDHLGGFNDNYDGPRSFLNIYHKGSDKTHDTARELLWLLGWSKQRLNMVICAGDEDQAALTTTAMIGIVRDNKWIGDRVKVTKLTARGASGSTLEVMSMDAYTGQGIFPDVIVADEWTHWKYDKGREFWDFILSTANKRPHCILKVNSNAGMKGTWQWDERNRIAKSKYWSFYEAPVGKPLPTWMNLDKIKDDSKGMSKGEEARLYTNRWVDPGEERGYLTLEDSERCINPALVERLFGERNNEYYLTLDYGGVFDRCTLSIMHAIPGKIKATIDRLDCWQGNHENRIEINSRSEAPDERSVEGWCDLMLKNFRVVAMVMDPTQLEALAIKYERRGVLVHRFEYRQGKMNHRMAQMLKTCVQNRNIEWSPMAGFLPEATDDKTFAQELSMLITKQMVYGYRFDHEAGRHDDRAVNIGMGLIHCLPMALPDGPRGPTSVKSTMPQDINIFRGVPSPAIDYAQQHNIFGMGDRDRRR